MSMSTEPEAPPPLLSALSCGQRLLLGAIATLAAAGIALACWDAMTTALGALGIAAGYYGFITLRARAAPAHRAVPYLLLALLGAFTLLAAGFAGRDALLLLQGVLLGATTAAWERWAGLLLLGQVRPAPTVLERIRTALAGGPFRPPGASAPRGPRAGAAPPRS